MSPDPTRITLGDREYGLQPQRIGRIGRKLSQVVELFAMASGQGQMPTEVGPRLYEALKVFIPDLDPIFKLAGYPSAEAYEAKAKHADDVRGAAAEFAAEHFALIGGEGDPPPFSDLPPEVRETFAPAPFEDPYDPEADHSPTPPELLDAIEAIFALHGGQRLVRLIKNFVSPEKIRGAIERAIERYQIEQALARSRSLQLGNGASGPTTSTTPAPTPGEPDDLASLSPAS